MPRTLLRCSMSQRPRALRRVALGKDGRAALEAANRDWGLALSGEEIDYLVDALSRIGARPDRCRTDDVRAGQFGALPAQDIQCRVHHRRRAGAAVAVRHDPRDLPRATAPACSRPIATMRRSSRARRPCGSSPMPRRGATRGIREPIDILMKVETHNHPTAISPFPGAATGAGGEIRDEGATGIGAKPKAGSAGFSVSNLRIPGLSALGGRPRQARAHRLGARHHARGADRARRLQQRIRPAEHLRLLSHLRASSQE